MKKPDSQTTLKKTQIETNQILDSQGYPNMVVHILRLVDVKMHVLEDYCGEIYNIISSQLPA